MEGTGGGREGREGKREEGREGKEGRLDGGGRGGRKGRNEGKGKVRGWEGELVPPLPTTYLRHARQYSGRREASFELSNATICPHGSKLWCSDLAIGNALRG